ncbi:MAG: IS630 family transposase [Acidobacteria bacterium]|nr:IS630 family transposase [Acidobacteriota bacterium]MBA4183053.1 IS630 family transposase [Acidobacteriota bacterium]
MRAGRQKWKRVRRSLREKRREELFRAAQDELSERREQLRRGVSKCEVWYFDEAGFSLLPSVPYAWQPIGERIELPSSGSQRQRQNVLGFLRWDGADFYAAAFEGRIDSHVVAGCFRQFAAEKKSVKPKLIVLANAPIHRSEEFEDELEELAKCGVYVMFLPSYSPELNLIEMLWKKIKYEWLPMDIYGSFKTMSEGLFEVLKGIGSKYRITFV